MVYNSNNEKFDKIYLMSREGTWYRMATIEKIKQKINTLDAGSFQDYMMHVCRKQVILTLFH